MTVLNILLSGANSFKFFDPHKHGCQVGAFS
jgi:hypothetical protein